MTKKTNIEIIRHSFSHILAAAVLELFPKTQLGVGPSIENGFYHDFDLGKNTISVEDLPKIEKIMKKIIERNHSFKRTEMPIEKALKETKDKKLKYRKELIEELKKQKEKKVSFYQTGDFINLCKGPHVKSTKELNPDAFKLTKVAGAYWKGDEKNPMLTRIYGVAFNTKKELDEYLKKQIEAEKRDHRKLGQDLDLFSIDEEVGPGLILWHPKGALLRQIIEDYWIKEHLENGYELIKSPHIGRKLLWQTSGHTDFYRENMFGPMEVEGDKYLIKPMNCPFHMKIYKAKSRSYRDLPVRWAELGTVYRYERSGVLHGLTRVRGFTQDDAHIICTPEQLSEEIMTATKFGIKLLKSFGFKDFNIYLSTIPEKYVGSLKNWEMATDTLKKTLNNLKLKYEIDEGGGVFYGPKIDIKIKDAIGREWQCTTVQFDFNLSERFNLTFIDDKGKKQRPYMVHRALLGSIERFVGVLLEHYSGALPTWLSPVQVWLLPIGKAHQKYLEQINKELVGYGIRTEIRKENETVSKKIREGEMQKIPYILVAGDKEIKEKNISLRSREKGDIGKIKIEDFIKRIKKEIEDKK